MATPTVEWIGMEEFKAFLATLPVDLSKDAAPIVTDAATLTYGEIRSRYKRKTGNLERHLKVSFDQSTFGSRALVANHAKHADWYEYGTKARHSRFGNKGAMKPAHMFVPIAQKHRRAMYARLVALVERYGFQVR